MTGPTYPELVAELFPRLTGGIRWGLDRTERLLAEAGDPHRRYWAVHVGGTNGKGSVAATLAAVLTESGRRTGLYTSPHLCAFRERIQVDGRPLEDAALLAAAERLWPAIRREHATFFEATTAIALLAFEMAGVEAAIIEVGLGGRLDATNVIRPAAVALTNVALDHAEFLGDTIDSVAREKAGIIKAGVPVVTAAADPAVVDLFRRRAAAVGAPFQALDAGAIGQVRVGAGGTGFRFRTAAWGELSLRTPLVGSHQATNAALAIAALERLDPERRPSRLAVERGSGRVRLGGRMQVESVAGQWWVLDVAHNPAGVETMVAALRELAPPRPLVCVAGILSDKDWQAMLPPIHEASDAVLLTVAPSAPEHRRWEPALAARALPAQAVDVVPDFAAALRRARELAGRSGTVLVTGSMHTVGDALIALGLAPHGVDPPLPASPHVV